MKIKLPVKLYFSGADKRDIIIFDEVGAPVITDILNSIGTYHYGIFRTRPVELSITLTSILFFVYNMRHFKISRAFSSNKRLIRNILWQLMMIYVLSDLLLRKPKIIITFIDNCEKFAWLCQHLKNIPCIAIQNGQASVMLALLLLLLSTSILFW